jgi:hypothetical protein
MELVRASNSLEVDTMNKRIIVLISNSPNPIIHISTGGITSLSVDNKKESTSEGRGKDFDMNKLLSIITVVLASIPTIINSVK